jgi:hypothetical protein
VGVVSGRLSVLQVQERHVSVPVTLRARRPWQELAMVAEVQVQVSSYGSKAGMEQAMDASVLAMLRAPSALQELVKDVLEQENRHEVVASDVWNAWEPGNASL